MPVIPEKNGMYRVSLRCSLCGAKKVITHWEDLTNNLTEDGYVPYHCGFCELETIEMLANQNGTITVSGEEITSLETIPRAEIRSEKSIVKKVCGSVEEIRYTKKGKKICTRRMVKRRVPTLFAP